MSEFLSVREHIYLCLSFLIQLVGGIIYTLTENYDSLGKRYSHI